MKYQVTNTIDNSTEKFSTIEEVNAHVQVEIRWFNTPSENRNNNGYDESDFIVEEIEK